MKAKIIITPKKAVLDPQGKTVQSALEQMGHNGITGVHIGKYIEIELAPGADKEAARKSLERSVPQIFEQPGDRGLQTGNRMNLNRRGASSAD